MKIILAILLGSFFGYALFKAGATNPKKLSAMLRLEDLSLAKIILFAIGLSSVGLSILNMVGMFNVEHFSVKTMNLGVIIGGVIFGLGFGLGGTCPGTCVGASGTGFKKAFSAILGGLIGALTFSNVYGYLNDLGLVSGLDYGKLTLFKISSEYNSVFNIGFIGLLVMGILFVALALVLPKSIIKQK